MGETWWFSAARPLVETVVVDRHDEPGEPDDHAVPVGSDACRCGLLTGEVRPVVLDKAAQGIWYGRLVFREQIFPFEIDVIPGQGNFW